MRLVNESFQLAIMQEEEDNNLRETDFVVFRTTLEDMSQETL
jgi:hypothetical protein